MKRSETLFVSDCHLDKERPDANALFLRFLEEEARHADALYILGDLFEYWIGDDDPAEGVSQIISGLAALSASGVPVFFLHGNRDFLIGKRFARRAGLQLLPEAIVVDLYGTPTLLMHGDTLCTDDYAYLRFRKKARNPFFQKLFLLRSLKKRRAIAQDYREKSRAANREKTVEIMDVNRDSVAKTMQRYGVRRLIHGHTHRPRIHRLSVVEKPATRIVLGDWYKAGSVLRVSESSISLLRYPA